MLSLKYKNIVKKALYENIDIADIYKENMKNIKKLSKDISSIYNLTLSIYLKTLNTHNYVIYIFDDNYKLFNDSNYQEIREPGYDGYDGISVVLYTFNINTNDKIFSYSTEEPKSYKFYTNEVNYKNYNEIIKDVSKVNLIKEKFGITKIINYKDLKDLLNNSYSENKIAYNNLVSSNKKISDNDISYNAGNLEDDLLDDEITREDVSNNLQFLEIYDTEDDVKKSGLLHEEETSSGGSGSAEDHPFNPQNLVGNENFNAQSEVYKTIHEKLKEINKDSLEKFNTDKTEDKIKPISKFIASNIISKCIKNSGDKNPFNIVDDDFTYEFNVAYDRTSLAKKDKESYEKEFVAECKESKIQTYAKKTYLSVDPAEVISPFVVLNMNGINWDIGGNTKSKRYLNIIFGDDTCFSDGIIQFPQARNYPLIDSMVAIQGNDGKYRKLGISTKGGMNGQGIQASLVSIFDMILKTDIEQDRYGYATNLVSKLDSIIEGENILNEKMMNNIQNDYCSDYGKELYKQYPLELSLILLFGGCGGSKHSSLVQALTEPIDEKTPNTFFKLKFNKELSVKEFLKYINQNTKITECIMKILNHQKYKFAQLNCKPLLSDNTFKYDYRIQYPAHFEGKVELKLGADGKSIRFHIVGAKQ